MLRRDSTRGAARLSWPLLAGVWGAILLAALVLRQPATGYLQGFVTDANDTLVWDADLICRGLDGPAAGQVWFSHTDRQGRFELAVGIGTVELEAYDDGRRTPAQQFVLSEGRTETVKLQLPEQTARWRWEKGLGIFAPEAVFTTDETPSVGITGAAMGAQAKLSIDRLDTDRLMRDKGGRPWLSAWRGEVGNRQLRDLAPYLQRVDERTRPLARDRDGEFQAYADVPVDEPGCYVVTISVGDAAERFAFQVTDLALVAKCDRQQVLVYACDLKTGEPQPNVALRLWDADGEAVLARGTTAADGILWMRPSDLVPDAYVVHATAGQHEALVRVGKYYDSGEVTRQTHLYTDRPIYRPGHHVYLKGIARDRTETGWVVPPAGLPVKLRIVDGDWSEVLIMRTRTNDFGSFAVEFDIPEEAHTGEFEIQCSVNGEHSDGSFRVEAYVKPEYSVKAQGPSDPVDRDDVLRFDLQANYFFGSPVSGGEVRYSIRRTEDLGHGGWDGWDSDLPPWMWMAYDADGEEYADGEEVATGKAKLDEFGHLALELPAGRLLPSPHTLHSTSPDGQPVIPRSTQRWRIEADLEVLDGSGRSEHALARATVLPSDITLQTSFESGWLGADQDAVFRVHGATPQGLPEVGREVLVETYRTAWIRDHWDPGRNRYTREIVPAGDYPGCLDPNCKLPHLGRRIVRTGPTRVFKLNEQGRSEWRVRLPRPGSWTFVASAADARGRLAIRDDTCDVSDRHGAIPGWDYEQDLELLSDREMYLVGDSAKVRIHSKEKSGWVLLTHEGDSLTEAKVLQLSNHVGEAQVQLTAADIPNGYVAAARVRDKDLEQEQKSLDVDLRSKTIDVQVTSNVDHAHPRDRVAFTVRATKDGQPVDAEVSLAVVDESIFAMRADHPERIVSAFYGRRWNRIDTFFSATRYYYNAGKDEGGEVRRYFPDTAAWRPFLRTGPSGEVRFELELPDSVTTWRATAVAHTRQTEVGFGLCKVVVNKPLMVRIETPRFFSLGDQTTISAVIHNESGATQDITVKIDAFHLQVRAAVDRHLTLEDGARKTLRWPAEVVGTGQATVRVSAHAGNLRDTVQHLIPSQPYAVAQRLVKQGRLNGTVTETLAVPANAVPGVTTLRINVAPTVAGTVLEAIDTLVGYPYGCVEQTTSRFLGCLAAARAYQKLGWEPESWTKQEILTDSVRRGVRRLRAMQHDNGSWGWWEDDPSNEWMSAYATYGLLCARDAGHSVDLRTLEQGLDWLAQTVKEQKPTDHAQRAFALYVLARAGRKIEPPWVTDLLDTKLRFSAAGMAMLAIVARQSNDTALERRALDSLWLALPHGTFSGVPTGDLAWSIRALLGREGASERVGQLVAAMEHQFDGRYWFCTRDTAQAVEALCDWMVSSQTQPVRGRLTVKVNGAALPTYTFDAQTARGQGAVYQLEGPALGAARQTVELVFDGEGQPDYTLVLLSQVAVDAAEAETGGTGLSVTRHYERVVRGRDGTFRYLPVKGALQVDDILRVTLVVRTKAAAEYVMLEDPLPSGFEVCDRGEVRDRYGHAAAEDRYTRRDVRDDRVAFFYNYLGSGRKEVVRYLLRAAVPGSYRALPARAEPMYDPAASARSDGFACRVR